MDGAGCAKARPAGDRRGRWEGGGRAQGRGDGARLTGEADWAWPTVWRADGAGPARGGREMADWAAGVKGGGTVRRKKRGTKHWVIFS